MDKESQAIQIEMKPGYAYKTIEEYESIIGFKFNDPFRVGWKMARLTSKQLGIKSEACPKCEDRGYYLYDDNHHKPCELCCQHKEGWWNISPSSPNYIAGGDNGCCKAGCGALRRNITN